MKTIRRILEEELRRELMVETKGNKPRDILEFCEYKELIVKDCSYLGEVSEKGGRPVLSGMGIFASRLFSYYVRVGIAGNSRKLLVAQNFSVNEGVIEGWATLERQSGTDASGKTFKPSECWQLRSRNPTAQLTADGLAYLRSVAPRYLPSVEEVMLDLVCGIQSILMHPTFIDWAGSLGYDSDSRRAESLYYGYIKQSVELQQFLGVSDYAIALDCVE